MLGGWVLFFFAMKIIQHEEIIKQNHDNHIQIALTLPKKADDY